MTLENQSVSTLFNSPMSYLRKVVLTIFIPVDFLPYQFAPNVVNQGEYTNDYNYKLHPFINVLHCLEQLAGFS